MNVDDAQPSLLDHPEVENPKRPGADAGVATRIPPQQNAVMSVAVAPSMRLITPMAMLNTAIEQGAGIDVIEKLMALQERWERNQARKAFEAAVAAAKASIPVIRKNQHVYFESRRTDSTTDYWHEDMGEIARTVDPILGAHGLSYRYRSKQNGAALTVTCVLAHADGYYEETELTAGNDATGNKNAHQGVGSAATYLQRYTLKLALGLAAAKDDDAVAASAAQVIGEPLTPEQVDEILALAVAAECPGVKLLAHLNTNRPKGHPEATEIGDIPASRFGEVVDAIQLWESNRAERAKKAKPAANAKA